MRLRAALAEAIGRDRFDLWFQAADSLQLNSEGLTVNARDSFTLDCLRRQYRADLERAYAQVMGRSPLLTFAVAATAKEQTPVAAAAAPRQAAENIKARPAPDEGAAPRRRFARLDTFIVGEGSRLAMTAVRMTAERPGQTNPLFLHGPTGSGKTHLLEGLWSAAARQGIRPALYLSAEQFTSHFLQALQGSGLPSFRRMHRDAKLLLIDDVQFFAGKKATLVELLHTIDVLLRDGRQIVFAADRPPSQLTELGPEIIGRLSGGLVCGLQPADRKTRLGILRNMAAAQELACPAAVLEELADQLPGDGRQLAGALNRLKAVREATQAPITLESARQALGELFAALRPAVSLADIERAVCDVMGVDSQTIHSDRRTKSASQPRMLAMWLARKHTRAALSEIGAYFGRRSHSTVVAAQRQIETWRSDGQALRMARGQESVNDLIVRIESRLRAG